MKYSNKTTMILMAICCHSLPGLATNFNDGINPDGPIQGQIQRDINPEFISQKVIARSRTGKNNILSSGDGNAGIGNIIIGPKANLKGAVILNQSEIKDASVISE